MAKATYMYWQKRFDTPSKDAPLIALIHAIRKDHPNAGYRRLIPLIKDLGTLVGKSRLQRVMKENNLQCKAYTRRSRKYSSYKGTVGKVAKNVLARRFKSTVPHEKITTDTTEFAYLRVCGKGRYECKKVYLDPFLDLYNNEVISYSVSDRPASEGVIRAEKEALRMTADCKKERIFHSDQGFLYQMGAYRAHLAEAGAVQSMSRKGNCHDNASMESFFGIMKQEMYYGKTYHSREELKEAIEQYIAYYNERRPKASLGYMSPVAYRLAHAE
ncbi:integrase core domain protein [Selenomonas artemidis F0399]|jgi:putative transposase insK for insertion sequence IS150|uniref:Integrase core domain protein n=2 Tax=Selenomonas TaxID=970 RepID=E7N1D5_9FIRM|nr:integrase core domain protein [Selenomonas artemidis F0399]